MSTEIIETIPTDISVLSDEVRALLAMAALDQGCSEPSNIPIISIKGKKFSVGDEKLGTSINTVILATVYDHAYYDREYDPDVVLPPACWAIGTDESTMAPDNVPSKQSESCFICPKNEFGSSKNGKGKACRNGRRLLIASVSDNKINLDDLAMINIPPTSLKSFSRYIKTITTTRKLPLWAVVTQLSFDDDSPYPMVIPNFAFNLDSKSIETIIPNLQKYLEDASVPYDCSGYEPLDIVEETAAKSKKSKMS